MRKAVTLIELIVAAVLISVVVLAAFTLDSVSRNYYVSSQTKAAVTNNLMYVVDHLQKKALRHNGNPGVTEAVFNNTGDTLLFSVDNSSTPSPSDFSDDVTVRYAFDQVTGQLVYCGRWNTTDDVCDGQRETLISNVENLTFSNMTDVSGNYTYGVYMNATAYVDRSMLRTKTDQRRNPSIAFNASVFFEEQSVR